MKKIVYSIIINIGYVLTIPLAAATAFCLIMTGIHKVVYTLVNLAFDQEDPYRPMRDLIEFGNGVHDMYAELYKVFC